MYKLNGFLNLANGEKQDFHIRINEKKCGSVTAVYIDAFSIDAIDPDFGAGIDIEISDVKSWFANYRRCEHWCSPAFGTDFKDIPAETQGLIVEKTDGSYLVILPVVSENYKCVLGANDGNVVTAKLFSWKERLISCKALAFMIAEGDNPYKLMEECAKKGLELLNHGCRTRKERRYPEVFEYLGWCSWDAFQIRVSEEALLSKCEEFKTKGIPVRWAMIDDMWAEVRDFYDIPYEESAHMFRLMFASKLYSFKADPRRFPNGLKGCIEKMKEYGLKVGMWHPTTGYWAGIDPEGEIYKELGDCLINTPEDKIIPDYKQLKAYKFYNAFHDYLRSCGAEFIKIDNQSMTRRFYKNLDTVGSVARQFHNAIEASVGQHFDNQMINCMGMASEDMWNRTVSPISRCSGDFQPENREWFINHILQCSFNCLVQGQFYYCDWDMWWSDDEQAVKNSVIRAISGGPIYVSDTYERSRKEILMPLVYEDGKILRCDNPATPTRDCLTTDPQISGKIFKIQNTCKGGGVITAFNLDEANKPVCGTISPKDIEGLEGEEFVIYEHFSKEFNIVSKNEKIDVTLKDQDDFRLYVIVPYVDGFAAIGRTDKFISPVSVKYVFDKKVVLVEDGPYAYVENGEIYFK